MSGSICPVHKTPWKYVKPGVSKAGKLYLGFYCCQDRDCPCRPEVGWAPQPTPSASRPTPAAPKPAAPNWDKIAAGKCRSLAICAWLQSGQDLDGFWPLAPIIQAYMMDGRLPFEVADMPGWDPDDPGADA